VIDEAEIIEDDETGTSATHPLPMVGSRPRTSARPVGLYI
jgi:hypothetical protein